MSRLEFPLGIRRRSAAGAVAGLGAALVLLGGSLSGLSDDILHFRGWSEPSVAYRGGSVGLAAAQPGTVADRRTGPAPARTAVAIVDAARALRGEGDRPQRASVRRTVSRPDAPGPRTRRPGAAPAPAAPQIVAQAPPAPAPAPAPAAPAPARAGAPEQVAAVPATRDTPTTRTPDTREATRLAGSSGKVKPARKKDAARVSEREEQTRTSTAQRVDEPREVAAPSVPGVGPDGQGAPGQLRKASSPGRGKHDRDHHGVGNVRGPRPKQH